jgi:hypothetical protein
MWWGRVQIGTLAALPPPPTPPHKLKPHRPVSCFFHGDPAPRPAPPPSQFSNAGHAPAGTSACWQLPRELLRMSPHAPLSQAFSDQCPTLLSLAHV